MCAMAVCVWVTAKTVDFATKGEKQNETHIYVCICMYVYTKAPS